MCDRLEAEDWGQTGDITMSLLRTWKMSLLFFSLFFPFLFSSHLFFPGPVHWDVCTWLHAQETVVSKDGSAEQHGLRLAEAMTSTEPLVPICLAVLFRGDFVQQAWPKPVARPTTEITGPPGTGLGLP